MATDTNSHAGITLLTGATGFIGRHCVPALQQTGARLRLLCRNPDKARQLFGRNVEVVSGDVLNKESLKAACAGVSVIYHVAGSYEFGPTYRRRMWQTNVDGTDLMLDAAWNARVERVIYCSTAGILYAPGRLTTQDDFPAAPPPLCHYKQSKWHGEARALAWFKRGLPVVITSPPAPIGAGDDRPTPTGRMFLELLRGQFPAYTHTGLNIVSVRDVAAGMVAAGQRGVPGRRYILGNENIWLGDLMKLAASVAQCPPPRFKVPWPVVAAAGMVGEALGRIGVGDGRICWETAYFARRRQFFDLQPTYDALGWKPKISTPVAVEDAITYFKALLANPSPEQQPTGLEQYSLK